MSKLQLKKELQQMSREQLEQMLLDAYDARKEVKEYFNFFLNPDVEKLTEKYKIAISKEFSRSKRGYSKARISLIKKMIKEFESFHPGFDKETELLYYTISYAVMTESVHHFTETLMNGIAQLMLKLVEIADRNMVADKVLHDLTAMLNDNSIGTRYFRRFLWKTLEEYSPQ